MNFKCSLETLKTLVRLRSLAFLKMNSAFAVSSVSHNMSSTKRINCLLKLHLPFIVLQSPVKIVSLLHSLLETKWR